MRLVPCSETFVVSAAALVTVATAQTVGLRVIEQYDRSRVFHSGECGIR
jgi:hypothetical protein